ncbi:MAG: magnesium transporter [Acidimicrobiales bacterium]|nr:magnesium transporter [Acidimicrobiales bacterium]
MTDAFERYPGLLAMIPAAIGLRGNVFSSLGSRVSTAIHTGEFRPSWRPGSVLGDNAAAALAQTLLLGVVIALTAAVVSLAFGLTDEVRLLDLVTVSVVGGLGASMVVLAATVILVAAAVRYEWDLDKIVAPVVSTLGDVVTVPALWLATFVLGHGVAGETVQAGIALVAVILGVRGLLSSRRRVRRVMQESLPVLLIAAVLSTLAGVMLEHQLVSFTTSPDLLVLQPAFVSSGGALGGLLAASLATGLHLGTVRPARLPTRAVRRDMAVVVILAVVVYTFNGAGANLVADLLGHATAAAGNTVAASLLGGAVAVVFVLAVAYYGTLGAYRLRVDPDTYGIPIVTSSVDFVGTFALIAAVAVLT